MSNSYLSVTLEIQKLKQEMMEVKDKFLNDIHQLQQRIEVLESRTTEDAEDHAHNNPSKKRKISALENTSTVEQISSHITHSPTHNESLSHAPLEESDTNMDIDLNEEFDTVSSSTPPSPKSTDRNNTSNIPIANQPSLLDGIKLEEKASNTQQDKKHIDANQQAETSSAAAAPFHPTQNLESHPHLQPFVAFSFANQNETVSTPSLHSTPPQSKTHPIPEQQQPIQESAKTEQPQQQQLQPFIAFSFAPSETNPQPQQPVQSEQTQCCVLGCTNATSKYKASSLKIKTIDFKPKFLENGLNKICRSCYSKDLKLWKQMQPASPPAASSTTPPATSSDTVPSELPQSNTDTSSHLYPAETFVRYRMNDNEYIGQVQQVHSDRKERRIVRYIIPTELADTQMEYLVLPEDGEIIETDAIDIVPVESIVNTITVLSYDEYIIQKFGQESTDTNMFYISENHIGLHFKTSDNKIDFR